MQPYFSVGTSVGQQSYFGNFTWADKPVTPFPLFDGNYTDLTVHDDVPSFFVDTVHLTYNAANGVLTGLLPSGVLVSGGAGDYTFTGTANALNLYLDTLSFTPTANQVTPGNTVNTDFNLTVASAGNPGATTSASFTISTTSVNDAPTIVWNPDFIASGDDKSPLSGLFAPLSNAVADPDYGAYEYVTVGFSGAAGSLASVDGGYMSSANTWSFNGTVAAANKALKSLVFTPNANQAPSGTQMVKFTASVNDGSTTTAATALNYTLTYVDDAPVVTIPNAIKNAAITSLKITTGQQVKPFQSVTVTDVDAGDKEVVVVNFDGTKYTALASSLAGGTITNAGTANAYWSSVSDTPANVQSVLQGLTFTAANTGWSVGNNDTAFGIYATDLAAKTSFTGLVPTVAVKVTATNAAPVLSGLPGSAGTILEDGATINALGLASVSDPDSATETAVVSIDPKLGSLSSTVNNAPVGAYDAVAGTWTYTGAASAVSSALQGLSFKSASVNKVAPGSTYSVPLSVTITDDGGLSTTGSTSVLVKEVDHAPGLTPGAVLVNGTLGSSFTPFTNFKATDTDVGASITATVTLNTAAKFTALAGGTLDVTGKVWTFKGDPTGVTSALDNLGVQVDGTAGGSTTIHATYTVKLDDGLGMTTSQAFSQDFVKPAVHDVNGDGTGDLILQNTPGTSVYVVTGAAAGQQVFAGSGYTLAASGDFNKDGHTDLVYQGTGGDIWIQNGNTAYTAGAPNAGIHFLATFAGWKVVGAGDVLGNGHTDVVVQNATNGSIYAIDFTDNGASPASGVSTTFLDNTLGVNAKVAAITDLNGDGVADLVLNDTTTYAAINVNSISVVVGKGGGYGWLGAPSTAWKLAGAGDVTGDGKSDIVFQNGAMTGIWTLGTDGKSFSNWYLLDTAMASGEVIQGVFDIGGDGKSELVTKYDNNTFKYYDLSGFNDVTHMAKATVSTYSSAILTDYHLVG